MEQDKNTEQQDKQQDKQEENFGSVYWAYMEDEWTLIVLLNLIILVNTSMKKQLNCLVLNPHFYIDYILHNCEGAFNFPLLQQYRQATIPAARQDYDDAVVQASIIAISTLIRNRVIPTKEKAVQARTDYLEVLYFTMPFWDLTENTDKIKGAQQASKETSSASGDEAESSSSESIDEL
eukprot:m51a1_g13611 hypothetical protein (179) ;mRNA; r:498-2080